MANHNNENPINKTSTNFMEIMLRTLMIGKTIYLDDGTAIFIDDINYQPLINHVFIKSGDEVYKMNINKNFSFDYEEVDRLLPTKEKIRGKYKKIN